MAIKHATKRMFSRASTRKKTINKGLSQEFVDSRRRLDELSASLKTLVKAVQSNKQQWMAVAKHQRDFSKTLSSTFPEAGTVHDHADEVELQLRNVQQLISDKDVPDAEHQQLLKVVDEYLKQIEGIEKEYKEIETRFTEKQRYEHKVDKLGKKNNSDKTSSKLTRNIEKLATAESKLDQKVNTILEKMRTCFSKHQVILQCAHHSYWMANYNYSAIINQSVQNIQAESVAVHDQLLKVNVQQNDKLMPAPRVNLIEEFDGNTNQPNSVTVVVDAANTTNSEVPQPNSPIPISPVVKQIPIVTSKNGTQLNIPDLPTELPKPPPKNIGSTKIATNATSPVYSPVAAT